MYIYIYMLYGSYVFYYTKFIGICVYFIREYKMYIYCVLHVVYIYFYFIFYIYIYIMLI